MPSPLPTPNRTPNRTVPGPRLGWAPILALLALLPSLVPTAHAQEADALFRALVPFGGLEVRVGGEPVADTEIFLAERAGAYLVLAPGLGDPLLVNVRARQVERVPADKVRQNENGTADLLADATFDTVGAFTVEGSELRFGLKDGRQVVLGPTPDLLGPKSGDDLLAYNAAYGFGAERYPPNEKNLAALKAEGRDVRVRVYFGSWCSTCSRVLPWILRVEEELEGSKIQFEYFGLPKTLDSPEAVAAEIKGVPTAVVSIDGKEIGRTTVPELGVPEKALVELLSQSSP